MIRKEERKRQAKAFLLHNGSIIYHLHREDAINRYIEEACISAAEWADKTMLDKACRWLNKYLETTGKSLLIEDFRKAMEE